MSAFKYNVGDKVYHDGREAIVAKQLDIDTMGMPNYQIKYADTSLGTNTVMEVSIRSSHTSLAWGAAPVVRAKCECGQEDKVGIKHSAWCPLAGRS